MMTFGGFLAFVACLFVGIGFLVPALLDRSLDRALHQLKALDSTDSRAYAMFSDNHEYPIRIAIYAVNCTNPEEVVATGAAPHFQEVGPFVYYMYRRAMNVSWTDDATTLTWRYNTRYMFALEESVASDDTMLYIPNIVFWGMASSLRESSPGMLVVIANAAKMSELDMAFAHRPLHEHIFGYSRESDPMLKFLSKDHEGLIKNHTDEADALKKAKLDTITTGYPDIRSLHQYVKYQEQEILRNADGSDWAWADKEAGRVHGSDGGAFPLPIDRAASPHIFVSSYYRSVQLDYIEDRDVKGIKLLRFNVPQKMWESAEKNPDNAKYDQEWDGLLNLRHPMAKVPFYLSRPRLHKADPRSQEHMTVDWLEPADKRHDSDYETYFDVEPTMGASMSIVTTSQLNLQMQGFTVQYEDDDQPVEKTFFANMKTPFLAPIFWANQTVLISDKDAHDFKGSVYGVFRIISVTPIVCYSIAGTIALIALLIALRGYKYHQLYRFEGHVFVETDNVDGNFASDDVLAAHEHRRFRRGKPGRADGGGRGDLEGVGLDSLAAHSAAHNGVAYGSVATRARATCSIMLPPSLRVVAWAAAPFSPTRFRARRPPPRLAPATTATTTTRSSCARPVATLTTARLRSTRPRPMRPSPVAATRAAAAAAAER